ncbi:hypothetical protein BCR39DRAFT_522195 [Naematelia encephala]|uniref:HhH-GPD domain-containing protein n=1 Tax=Naematelia encephala TaxID=71784 RepID=A0A1Y2BDS5_9TREE|nr:hypothetical protein BCR39DRAFT_522195 [Naematelia encephala]
MTASRPSTRSRTIVAPSETDHPNNMAPVPPGVKLVKAIIAKRPRATTKAIPVSSTTALVRPPSELVGSNTAQREVEGTVLEKTIKRRRVVANEAVPDTSTRSSNSSSRKAPTTTVKITTPKISKAKATKATTNPTTKKTTKPTIKNSTTNPTNPTTTKISTTNTAPPLLPGTLPFSLPDAMSHLSKHDPRFASMFTHLPCKPFQPPHEAIDPFRTLVTSIIGQQVSWMAARAINGRFRALFGYSADANANANGNNENEGNVENGGKGNDGNDGFPTPDEVMKTDVMVLKSVGLSLRKAEYVVSLAEHFVSGELSTELLRDGTDEEISKALLAVRGIGQWTVDMFLMFSLRRPDVLPVGDLGVQKGLLRWILAAHGTLPKSNGKPNAKAAEKWRTPKKKDTEVVRDKVDNDGRGEIDTMRITPEPGPSTNGAVPPTPVTPKGHKPKVAVLHTSTMPTTETKVKVPLTPITPGNGEIKPAEDFQVGDEELPPPAPAELLAPPTHAADWDVMRAAPLEEGLSIEVLKARLAGKKVKGGAYLTAKEMEALTDGWRPFRSLGVYYMWPAGEDF